METSPTLLNALRGAGDSDAWAELVNLYAPLIRGWLVRMGARPSDLDDMTQDVLTVVVSRVGEFDRNPQVGSFRSWLRTIAVNCWRSHIRKQKKQAAAVGGSQFGEFIAELEDPNSGLSKLWDREHDHHVMQHLFQQTRGKVAESTWRAFERFAIDGLSAREAAEELGVSENAIFIAKSRVMTQLRQRGRGLID
ncbi:MAG: sigma-70 family RNA polymerase sigma factor [bacterium]|nr:sigma-70 family RNA polymerase sigma factor [bacterium]